MFGSNIDQCKLAEFFMAYNDYFGDDYFDNSMKKRYISMDDLYNMILTVLTDILSNKSCKLEETDNEKK